MCLIKIVHHKKNIRKRKQFYILCKKYCDVLFFLKPYETLIRIMNVFEEGLTL